MPIKIGSADPVDFRHAGAQLKEVRLGSTLLWSSAAGTGYWCNMVAGLDPIFESATGYQSASHPGPCGSIDREPIAGSTLYDLMSIGGEFGTIRWLTDVSALLTGKRIYINGGSGYPLTGIYGDGEFAQANFDSYPLGFVVGQTYLIDIRD